MKKYIMLFPAHADDVELQAAGILARYLDKGYNAVYVMVTDNCFGGIIDKEERLSYVCPAKSQVIRHEETREAAKMFGLEPIFLSFKQRLFYDAKRKKMVFLGSKEYDEITLNSTREPILIAPSLKNCIKDIASLIKRYEPQIVLTHSLDVDPEHRSTCNLIFSAFKEASKQVELGSLYSWGPSSGGEIIHISPDTFVDISDYLDIKYRAFLKHKSQATQLRKSLIKERASFWGKKIGVKYAEAFRTIIRGKLGINVTD